MPNQAYNTIAFVASHSPKAQETLAELTTKYGDCAPEKADVIVAIGGDGTILEAMHEYMELNLPIYGLHRGSIGFLTNQYQKDDLLESLNEANPITLHPLRMQARAIGGQRQRALAFNEVSLLRETRQTAKIQIVVDDRIRLEELICDGILLSTAAGSTAYNLSAHGPIVPIGSGILALTPISAFRPRRWRGALLPHTAKVTFSVREPEKRPVSAVADNYEVRDVSEVKIEEDTSVSITLLFDPEHNFEERVMQEQFAP